MTTKSPETYTPPAERSYPPAVYQAPTEDGARTLRESKGVSRDVASEMHRWGRMTGVFSILAMMTWLLLDTVPSVNPALAAVKSTFLWPGITLMILAAIGLIGGFGVQYLAGRKR